MNFARRLRAYTIGLTLGVLLVVAMFKERLSVLTAWLPENRVLQELNSSDLTYSPAALCELKCLGLDTSHVSETMREGKVRFSLSETHTKPRVYAIDQRIGERLVRMHFALSEPNATLIHAEAPIAEVACGC